MLPDVSFTAFNGHRRIASGPLHAVALAIKRTINSGLAGPVLVFDDTTGRAIDIDTRGSDDEITRRFTDLSAPRGRGRPKLGVVAREVTLLPRHWDWLATQPGGASVALRKLVEQATRAHADADRRRAALERAYHFMSAMAGDMPGFEEAARALFAVDEQRLRKLIAEWPHDVREHAITLAFGNSPPLLPLSGDRIKAAMPS